MAEKQPLGSIDKNPEAAAGEPVNSGSEEKYEVKAGDSCYSIARKYGMKVARFLEINGKAEPKLQIGEIVKVEKTP